MICSDPAVSGMIAPTSLAQLEENLKSLEVTLTPEQMARLNTAGNP